LHPERGIVAPGGTTIQSGSPYVGRATELTRISAALDALGDGTFQAVEILGPGGIGKTRLLHELAAAADQRGYLVLSGSGAELEQDLPFWVFADALDPFVEALAPSRLQQLGEQARAELGQVLPSLAPPAGVASQVHERHRVHRAVRELLERLAGPAPLVLVLDDVHWADPASIDLLVALLHRPPSAGVLIALGARPRQLPVSLASALDRVGRDRSMTRLELQPLTRAEAQALIGGGDDASLYEESGGNPFFLEQLARRVDGRPTAGTASEGLFGGSAVPPTVIAALTDELGRLSADATRVLDAASVAGDPFEVDLAAAAAGLPEPAVLDAIDELAAFDFVRLTDLPRRFRFRHPIVRRAVYEATPGGWRISAHERVAGLLRARGAGAASLAHHVERSARHGDPVAISTLREAGLESLSRAPHTAARWLEAAARLLPEQAPTADRVELVFARARALVATGQFERGHTALLECSDLVSTESPELQTRVAATCAHVEHLLGLHEQAHDRLVRMLDDLPDERSPESVALMIELTMDGLHRMNYPAMHAWGQRAGEAAEALDDDVLRAAAFAAAARGAAFPGETEAAIALTDRALGIIDRLDDRALARRLDALGYLAGAELYLHRWKDAQRHALRALGIGQRTGQGQQFPLLNAIVGVTGFFLGQSRDLTDQLDEAVEAARLSGNGQTVAWSLYGRALAAVAVGDLATAMSAAQEAVDLVDDGAPSHHASHAAFVVAEVHVELGKPELAADILERSGGGPQMPLSAAAFRGFYLETLVRARLAIGDRAAAEAAAQAARSSAETGGLPTQHAWALRAEAELALAAGAALDAAALALESAACAERGGAVIEQARSLALAGRAYAAADDSDRARALLLRANETFDRCGAARYRDAAEHELRRLGHRIHRRSGAGVSGGEGVAALTKRELEIARLIVDRQTNRQIAEVLFLSPKTVETHVRNLFVKLGADSRVEVARIVEQASRAAAGR
jgi:DNA-binding NarL/FixJ family response regulator